MPTSNLKVDWNAPTTGATVASYRLEARKGTTGAYTQLATNISPVQTDPQTHTLTKADIDTNLENPADGDTIQVRAIAVGESGSTSQPGQAGQITVPAA